MSQTITESMLQENAEKDEVSSVETINLVEFSFTDQLHEQIAAGVLALEITSVSEVVELQTVTPVPNSDKHIIGVANLRGKIIPLVDLSYILTKVSLDAEINQCCAIMLETGESEVGLVVKELVDLSLYPKDKLIEVKHNNAALDLKYIDGFIEKNDQTILVLSTEEIKSAINQIDSKDNVQETKQD